MRLLLHKSNTPQVPLGKSGIQPIFFQSPFSCLHDFFGFARVQAFPMQRGRFKLPILSSEHETD
jgi:hypothetical protein